MTESTQDMIARLVKLEVLVAGVGDQMKTFTDTTNRLVADQRATSEAQTRALQQLQEHNANARREDQDAHRRAMEQLQESGRIARQEDQKTFNAALADTLKKVETISTSNMEMADKYIKREDLLWLRQAVGSLMLLVGGGLWTWWLNLHK